MKKYLTIVSLAAAVVLLATPASASLACVSGTYASYISGGSCSINGLTFSGFTYASAAGGTAVAIAAKIVDIIVTIGEPELFVQLVTARHHRLLWR